MCYRPPDIEVAEIICPKCAASNQPGDTECYACGLSLEGVPLTINGSLVQEAAEDQHPQSAN